MDNIKLQLLKRIMVMEAELKAMRKILETDESRDETASRYDFVVRGIPEKLDGRRYIIFIII